MATRRRALWLWIGLLLAALLGFASIAYAAPLAQDDSPGIDSVTPVPPLETPEVVPSDADEAADAAIGPAAILAAPSPQMNYQGYLTDASGVPLAGEHDLIFRLYNASTGGAKRWGDEVHNNVPVSKGLFQVVLGSIAPLDPATMFDEQLYLEVEVDGNVLPRQMLHAAPYAMALTAGAQVRGSTSSAGQYGLTVVNSTGKGIYADAHGDNVDAIYSADRIYSLEGYAGPDSYVWLPVQNMVLKAGYAGDADIQVNTYSDVVVAANVAGFIDVIVPIQLERPYGRNYQVEGMTVYYQSNAPHGAISATWLLGRDFGTGTAFSALYDATDQTSTTYNSYTIVPPSPFVLSSTQMTTNVQFRFEMSDTSGEVTIYGIRLRLGSAY